MTEIKLCGITNKEDALFAAACGVDALGFIFYASSPRNISPEKVRAIISELPHQIAKVGVFVNHNATDVNHIYAFCGLDFIQLHGDESAAYCSQFPSSLLIKAVSLQKVEDVEALGSYLIRAILVDARDSGRYGGTGKQADWRLAMEAKRIAPLILSGGLREENIREAIAEVLPQAVDINSGVESSPGKKDWTKVRRIIEIIRNADNGPDETKIFRVNNRVHAC